MKTLSQEIQNAIAEIQQPRSRFQLEHFVLGQHVTPEMQYYQLCLELQEAIFKYRTAEVQVKITEKKIGRLLATGDDIDELKAQQKKLGLDQTRIVMLGAEREIAHLVDMWNSFEYKYSREEIELAQPNYWETRLINNARAMIMGGAGVNPAHLEAMAQAGILEKFIEQNRLEAENELRNLES